MYSEWIYSICVCLFVFTPDAYVYLCVHQMYIIIICTLYVCMYMCICWIVYGVCELSKQSPNHPKFILLALSRVLCM